MSDSTNKHTKTFAFPSRFQVRLLNSLSRQKDYYDYLFHLLLFYCIYSFSVDFVDHNGSQLTATEYGIYWQNTFDSFFSPFN